MKQIISALICISIMLALPQIARAHPGGTDSSGGHTDRSTGEYHYHHGYSAHQHYDMDGDGKADCPYDFRDNTGHRNGSSNSGDPGNNATTPPVLIIPDIPEPDIPKYSTEPTVPKTTTAKKEETKPVPTWIYWCFGILSVILLWMGVIIYAQKEDKEIVQYSHKNEIKRLNEQHNEEISRLKSKYEESLREKDATDEEIAKAVKRLERVKETEAETWKKVYKAQSDLHNLKERIILGEESVKRSKESRLFFQNAPLHISLSADGKPVYWKPDPKKPYGDYTVYVKQGSEVYHTDRYCASYFSKEAHIFDYISKRRPCQKCARNAFDFTEAPEWYTAAINERLNDRSNL